MSKTFYKQDLIYPELSYNIIDCAYKVFNEIGGGHKENVYQKAMSISLKKFPLQFKEQLYYPISFSGIVVGKNYFDFFCRRKNYC